jgi:hypothetical protein
MKFNANFQIWQLCLFLVISSQTLDNPLKSDENFINAENNFDDEYNDIETTEPVIIDKEEEDINEKNIYDTNIEFSLVENSEEFKLSAAVFIALVSLGVGFFISIIVLLMSLILKG